jgi:hypothetical protein
MVTVTEDTTMDMEVQDSEDIIMDMEVLDLEDTTITIMAMGDTTVVLAFSNGKNVSARSVASFYLPSPPVLISSP